MHLGNELRVFYMHDMAKSSLTAWLCAECLRLNYARRDACHGCGRPPGPAPGGASRVVLLQHVPPHATGAQLVSALQCEAAQHASHHQ